VPEVLRVHLTAEDLLRTRFASQPAPLIELGNAVAALQRLDPAFGRWRRLSAARLPLAARELLDMVPPDATGPLFLDPVSTGLAEGLELVQRTPATFVTSELRHVAATRAPAPLLRLLAERDRQAWRQLDQLLRMAYHSLLQDAWPRVCQGYRAEVAWRGRLMAELGAQAALCTLHPRITWNGTVMQIEAAREMDVRPGGAGMTLLPSLLWTGRPMVGRHTDGSVLIVYPALTPLPLIDEVSHDPLADLLGHTRAAVLDLARTERTTTEMARELGISAASVSAHTKTLRSAGLIVTTRAGKSVLHTLTPLGDRLLQDTGRSLAPAAPYLDLGA
jgi:biotin operon repressor